MRLQVALALCVATAHSSRSEILRRTSQSVDSFDDLQLLQELGDVEFCQPFSEWFDGPDNSNPNALPAGLCLDHFSACARQTGCRQYILTLIVLPGEEGHNPNCTLSTPPHLCFESLGHPTDGIEFQRAVALGACILCCNNAAYKPASFEWTPAGSNVTVAQESDCTCRAQNDVAQTPCTIPFFYDGMYHRDCVDIDGVPMCARTIFAEDQSELVECAPINSSSEDPYLSCCSQPGGNASQSQSCSDIDIDGNDTGAGMPSALPSATLLIPVAISLLHR